MDSANFPRKELLMLPDFLRVVYGRVYPRTLKVLHMAIVNTFGAKRMTKLS